MLSHQNALEAWSVTCQTKPQQLLCPTEASKGRVCADLKDSLGLALHSLIDKRERIAGFAIINCKYGFIAGAYIIKDNWMYYKLIFF